MPEGHTLRRLADELDASFAGRPVRVSSPQGRFAADADVLDGETLVGADSAGKHLFVEFPGDERHVRRIGQMSSYETTGELPPLPASARSGPTTPDA